MTTNYVLCQHCSGDRDGKESADRFGGPNNGVDNPEADHSLCAGLAAGHLCTGLAASEFGF